MEHSAPSAPSTRLTIKTYDGKTLTLSPEEVAALPHKSVTVFNAHSKTNETYSGVPLADLLSKVGVPLGESVRGKLFLIGVVAEGMDDYSVLYSLAEVDPAIHTGDVIVADTLDGKKLDKDGAVQDGFERRAPPGSLGAEPDLNFGGQGSTLASLRGRHETL